MNEYQTIMADINKHVIENLNHYLATELTEYAILLFGEWGTGKTYFINSYIENFNNNSDNPNQQLLKVSLFGLKTTDEIDEKIFEAIHPILTNKKTKLLGNIVKGGLKLGGKLTGLDIDLDINLKKIFDSFESKGDITLIFDDIERTDIPLKEALGYINYLVEVINAKVILIANEDFILSSTWKEDYKAFKEKVIGKSLKITHDIDSILNTLLDTSNSLLKQQADMIKDIYLRSGYQNIRLLKQTINDFCFLLDHLNSLDTKYLKNNNFLTLLTKNFFILNIEAKQGTLNKENLEQGVPFIAPSEQQPLTMHFEKYSINQIPLFSGAFWVEIIFNFNFKNIQHEINPLPFFKKRATQSKPKWLKLLFFGDLENAKFRNLVNGLQKDFNDLKLQYITSYMHSIALMVFFVKKGLVDDSIDNIKNKVQSYILKYAHSKYSKYWRRNYKHRLSFNDTGYVFYNYEDNDFQELYQKLLETNDTILKKIEYININKQFISLIKKNLTEDLISFFADRNDFKPIFNQVNPDEFVNNLAIAKNVTITYIEALLSQNYLQQAPILNGLSMKSYLIEELPFWEDVSKKIEAIIVETKGLNKYLLTTLKGTIEKIVVLLKEAKPT